MTIEYVVKTRKSLAPGQTDKTTGKLWYYKVTLLLLHEPTNPWIFHVLLYFRVRRRVQGSRQTLQPLPHLCHFPWR